MSISGWKMDVAGNVVDMSSEPAGSELKQKIKQKAYPTVEWAGVIWTYMGPEESRPEFQPPPWAPKATTKVSIAKIVIPCNWAQILEGAIDSAHSSSLHSSIWCRRGWSSAKATSVNWLRPSTDKAPRLQSQTSRIRLSLYTQSDGRSKVPTRTTTFASPCSWPRSPF